MRLLIVNALYPPHAVGGAERSVALLAEALAAAGDDVHVATLARFDANSEAVERGVTVHRLPLDNDYWPWTAAQRSFASRGRWHLRDRWNRAAAARIGRLIDRVRPELVHTQVLTGFSASVWPAIKRRSLPLVHTLRDYSLICGRAALFRKERNCTGRCADCRLLTGPSRAASRLVDAVVGNSGFVIDAHRDAGRFVGVPARRLFNIVPLPEPLPPPPATADERPLTFGFLGRIEPEKGIDVLLAALPLVGRSEWRLRIGGSGEMDRVCRLRRDHPDGRIAWLGQVEAGAFYRSIDVLIVPSLWSEPLPRTLIEGVSHGRSIIATQSGGIPEVAAISRCHMLCRPGDPLALAAAMRRAIDQPARWRAGGASSGHLLSAFTPAAAVGAHHELYAETIAKAPR